MKHSTEYRYFNGDTELLHVRTRPRSEVWGRFPTGRKIKFDDFQNYVGYTDNDAKCDDYVPADRRISYKLHGSKHVCDARCRCAKGGNCECSCGGKFHGIDR